MKKLFGSEITRRGFITKVGQGLLAANVAGPLLRNAHAELVVPEPPGKKLGWAIVGLGSLAINQILPAFAKCEKSKVTAFVSGHPEKAHKLALRYGVSNVARLLLGDQPVHPSEARPKPRPEPDIAGLVTRLQQLHGL